MTQKQKDAITVLNKIKEQWWNTMEGHTNLSEEDYMAILEGIVDGGTQNDYISIMPKTNSIPCFEKDGICTNPFHDCIGCPRRFTTGGWATDTTINYTTKQ